MQERLTQLKSVPVGYAEFLDDLKRRIREIQVKASLSVNRELLRLYWHIGRSIVVRQRQEGWGKGIVEQLSGDLQQEFPGIQGLSAANIWRMRAFYIAYAGTKSILAQPVREFDETMMPKRMAEIPWGHNVVLLEKLKNNAERLWYAEQTIQNGWSRNVLLHQIESNLYRRKGKALTNFPRTLPAPQSDLAQQLLKDPYAFDFLTLTEKANERELQQGLIDHLRDFLLELGVGFAFVGSQYHLEVAGEDFYLDLLFYHTRLHCYIVVDLKMSAFKPEYAGKMNFYLSAVDDRLRESDDHPSIGMILCKSRNKLIVEYALRDTSKPIGVAAYKLTSSLPKNLKGSLPTIEELESQLIHTSISTTR